jgi:hypothetical protein
MMWWCLLGRHHAGPPRLDERGRAWAECVVCCRVVPIRAQLAPSPELLRRVAAARSQVGAREPGPQASTGAPRGDV